MTYSCGPHLCVILQAVILCNYMSTHSMCVNWSLETKGYLKLNEQPSLSVQASSSVSELTNALWTPSTQTQIPSVLLSFSVQTLIQ